MQLSLHLKVCTVFDAIIFMKYNYAHAQCKNVFTPPPPPRTSKKL